MKLKGNIVEVVALLHVARDKLEEEARISDDGFETRVLLMDCADDLSIMLGRLEFKWGTP